VGARGVGHRLRSARPVRARDPRLDQRARGGAPSVGLALLSQTRSRSRFHR
jgi:hypothetical protein